MRPLDLKFRLDELTPEGRAFTGELPQAELEGDLKGLVGELGFRALSAAAIEGTVYRSAGGEVIVDGRFECRVGFDCVRCLSARELTVGRRADHVLVKKRDLSEAAEPLIGDVAAGPEEHAIEGDEVDLTEIYRQDVVLEMPMNPTCELAGRACEATKAREALEGQEAPLDPRWAPLLELRKSMNSDPQAEAEVGEDDER